MPAVIRPSPAEVVEHAEKLCEYNVAAKAEGEARQEEIERLLASRRKAGSATPLADEYERLADAQCECADLRCAKSVYERVQRTIDAFESMPPEHEFERILTAARRGKRCMESMLSWQQKDCLIGATRARDEGRGTLEEELQCFDLR